MTIETQIIDLPFAGGVDEKTRTELVGPPSFAQLVNLRQIKRGSYEKRLGHAALQSATLAGGTVPIGKRLLAYKDELLQTDGKSLYTRSQTLGAWSLVPGLPPQLVITDQPTMALQNNVGSYDVASVNGYNVVAAVLPNAVGFTPSWTGFATVIDAASGAAVAPPAVFMSGSANAFATRFCLVTVGNLVVALYSGTAASSIFYSWLDTTSAATISNGWQIVGAALVTDTATTLVAGGYVFDACALGTTQFGIAYVNNSNVNNSFPITVRTFNASFVQQATSAVIVGSALGAGTLPISVAISGDLTDAIYVAYSYNGGNTVRVTGLNPTTLAISGTAAVLATVSGTAASIIAVTKTATSSAVGSGWMVCGDPTSNFHGVYTRSFHIAAGAVVVEGSNQLSNWSMQIDSRPFLANGRVYCMMRPTNNVGQSVNDLFLVDLTQSTTDRFASLTQGYLRIAGHILPRLAYAPTGVDSPTTSSTQNATIAMHVIAVSATKVLAAAAALKSAASSSLDLVTLDWGTVNLAQPSVLGETLAIAGSPPSSYDGARATEIGFFQRPQITATALTAGGISSTLGGYKYVAVYEQIDARGQWHQSNVSDPTTPVVPTNQSVTITIKSLQCTNRADVNNTSLPGPNAIRAALYRTSDGGTVYKRVRSAVAGNVDDCSVMNNPIANTITFPADTVIDANLGAPLYSQPGIPGTAQVKVTPPSLSCMIAHGDRLVGCDGKTVWYSGQTTYGEGYWFADVFQFTVETGGAITALASLDGDLVIFKRNAIAFVFGQGPPDNGAGGDFSPPQFIATDVGCINPRSVVVTPDGVIFQSLRGLEMLSRSRQLAAYFGNQVEDSLTLNPVITSAVLDESQGQVTFTCLPTETSTTGITLTWNYVFSVWTTGTTSDGGLANAGAKSAVMWGQNPGTAPIRTWMQNVTGTVFQESVASYLDAGAWVPITMVTPWAKTGGVAGFQIASSLILQAFAATGHDLTISIAYDYSPTYTDVRTWTAAQIAALATANETLQVDLTQPECTAFRVKITDAVPSSGILGTGRGPILWGLQVNVGSQGILALLPAGNRQ